MFCLEYFWHIRFWRGGGSWTALKKNLPRVISKIPRLPCYLQRLGLTSTFMELNSIQWAPGRRFYEWNCWILSKAVYHLQHTLLAGGRKATLVLTYSDCHWVPHVSYLLIPSPVQWVQAMLFLHWRPSTMSRTRWDYISDGSAILTTIIH